MISRTKWQTFSLSCLRGADRCLFLASASCLLPVALRLHQGLQALPQRAQLAPLPGDNRQRGKPGVISV